MVATTAAPVFSSLSSLPSSKTSMVRNGCPDSLETRVGRGMSKSTLPGGLQVKASAQSKSKVNGTKAGLDYAKDENFVPVTTQTSRTFINQLPDWSMLLAAITTLFLAAEKQWTNLDWDWKPKRPDMLVNPFGFGRIVQEGLVFRQNFLIRSYEIGADRTASIDTLMNHLQETALNHVRSAGLQGEGFGATPEMSKRNLIWVVAKMQVVVDCYPSWELDKWYQATIIPDDVFCLACDQRGDFVQVDTWACASGKNGMRRDWLARDGNSGQVLTRATSLCVMMNKKTRRLSKIPDEVRGEIEPYLANYPPVLEEDGRKLPKLDDSKAEFVQRGLLPRWGDLDVNLHVNNVKYLRWLIETIPETILESRMLTGLTLEYRRECGKDNVLQSLITLSSGSNILEGGSAEGPSHVECHHLLRLESGEEIVRGRTEWSPKCMPSNSTGHFSPECA